MVQYLAKRIGRSILTLFVIVTLVFCLLRLMPVEGYFANYEKMTEATDPGRFAVHGPGWTAAGADRPFLAGCAAR